MLRNYKWIWVPLAFILLGIMQPLSTYYMPEIIETMGGLPEGTVIELPTPSSGEVIVETFAQFSMIGTLIIVLATMGLLAGERQSGVAGLIMVKPVRFTAYVSAKWAGALTLVLCSFLLGMLGAGYYSEVLFGELDFSKMLLSVLIYSLWLIAIVSITLFFSAMMKGLGTIAFLSLITVMLLTMTTSLFDWLMKWSPAKLPEHAYAVILTGETLAGFGIVITVTAILVFALVLAASSIFARQELIQ